MMKLSLSVKHVMSLLDGEAEPVSQARDVVTG